MTSDSGRGAEPNAPGREAGQKSLEKVIAESTAQLRRARGMTLAELSERAGVSRQMISKIENEQTSASLATVQALARGLDVPVTSLFRGIEYESQVVYVQAGSAPEIVRGGSKFGHTYHMLGRLKGAHADLEPMLVTLNDDTETEQEFQHSGTQFIYVLDGEMDYKHQDRSYRLKKGDALLFDGEGTHGPAELLQTPVKYLSVFVDHRP